MKTEKTALAGLLILTPDAFGDDRGVFFESYQDKRYQELGIPPFVQDNVSRSKKGVLRGLHYQVPPMEQGKLVQVLAGKALDVAVDIRHGSPTFGQYVAVELSAENRKQFWIPAGFTHGFMSLADDTVFQYKCTGYYSKEHERGLRFDDPALGIVWPFEHPTVNDRDRMFPHLHDIGHDFTFQSN